jgi:hypothetical protein
VLSAPHEATAGDGLQLADARNLIRTCVIEERSAVHSFLATSGPVMRASSGKVAAMMPRAARIPAAMMR